MSTYPSLSPPPLTRRDEYKVLAGVCSGVAYRLGVDPNVVRVITVVLSLFGGAGVLLYALGWLLLPEAPGKPSLAERALRGGAPDGLSTIVLAVVLAVVAVAVAVLVVGDSWFGITVLVVAVTIGAVLLTRRTTATPLGGAPGAPDQPPAPPAATRQAAAPQTAAPAPTQGYAAYGSGPSPYGQAPTTYASFPSPAATAGATAGAPPFPPTETSWQAAPPPQRQRRPRSYLGAGTTFTALAAVGVLGIVDAAGASVTFSAYLATALAVVGLGLLAGTWVGRSRALIGLGVALLVVLVPVTTIEQLGIGDRTGEGFETVVVVPETARSLDGTADEYSAGDIRYDLTDIDFVDRDVTAEISVGAGNLQVDVPEEVTVVLDAQVGAGQVDAFGEQSSGLGVDAVRTDDGEPDGGTLRLTVQMGFGNVEVSREGA